MAHLMIVDDDEDFATAIARVLRRAGHDVTIQLEAATATRRIEQARPDLVILDVMFPESSSAGFDLARELRESDETRDIPILMLTAVNQRFPLGFGPSDVGEDWLPVTDFVEKPVDLDLLEEKVAAILA